MARTERSIGIGFAALLLASCTSEPTEPAAQPVAQPAPSAPPSEVPAERAPRSEIPAESKAASKPTFFLDVATGLGEYDHNTEGGGGAADGDTVGAYASLQLEMLGGTNWGGGFAVEGLQSDDDLFEHSGSPDSEGQQLDLFVYMLGIAHETDTFRIPVRMGPYVHQTSIEEQASGLDLNWNAIGLRFEAEPEEWITRGENFSWGLYAQGSIGVHRTFIDAEATGFSEDYNGRGMTWGGGFGVQALFGQHIKARLGYLVRQTEERDSSSNLGVFINEMSASFDGVVLEMGFQF
jgi:opacity protein-like surface antigen